MGGSIGRIATGIASGGLTEIGRAVGGSSVNNALNTVDNYYLPVAGTIAGSMIGGPAGGMIGGTLGGALNGNAGQGAAAGGIGALLQSLMGGAGGGMGGMDMSRLALGGSLLGYGLAQNPDVQRPDLGNWQNDNQAIDDQMGRLRGLYSDQNDLMSQSIQNSRNNLMRQLTDGPEGEAFRQKYNNLGLLNSGAFNQGLANQFANQENDAMNQIIQQRIAQTQGLADLSNSRLSRQFGLEDVGTQFNIAQAIQNAQQKSQLQQALLGGGSYILGGGMPSNAAAGASGGGSSGGILSGLGGSLGSMLSSLLGNFRSGTNTGGELPNSLSLIPGGSPSNYFSRPLAY